MEFGLLQQSLVTGPFQEVALGERGVGHGSEIAKLPDPGFEGLSYGKVGEREGIGGDNDVRHGSLGNGFAEQHAADPSERLGVAGEIAHGVEGRGLGHETRHGDPAVGRPQAVKAAEAGRDADRSP